MALRDVARGASWMLVAQVVRTGSRGLVVLLLTRLFLSPAEYGLLFFAVSVLGVAVTLASLGFAKSGSRYVAEYRERDPGQIPHVLRVTLAYNLIVVALTVVALVAFHDRIATLLGEPALAPLLLVGGAYVAALSLQNGLTTLFQGFGAVTWSAVVGTVGNVALVTLVVAFLWAGAGPLGTLVGYTLAYALAVGVGLVVLYRRFYRQYDDGDPEPGLAGRVARYAVPLTATRSAHVLDNRVDSVLIGYFLNATAVGFYTLGKQVADFVIAPAYSLGFAVSPTYGERKAADRLDRAAETYHASFRFVVALYAPAAVGMALVADPAVHLLFGPDYAGAVPVIQLFGLFVLARAIEKITTDGLDYLGRARVRAVAKVASALANFGLNLVLIPRAGVVGAAAATVVTYWALVLFELVVVCRELPVDASRLARTSGLVAVVTAGVTVVVFPLSREISSLPLLAGVVGAGVASWAALGLASGLIDVGRLRAALG
ncbi:MAG: flippase [Haloarculaceae archaeon]